MRAFAIGLVDIVPFCKQALEDRLVICKDWLPGSPFKSAPAENARPVPVMIPQQSFGSASSQLQSVSSSAWPSELMQLRSFGLFSRTRRMLGVGKDTTQYLAGGTGVPNCDSAISVYREFAQFR